MTEAVQTALIAGVITVIVTIVNQALSWVLYRPNKREVEATAASLITDSAKDLLAEYRGEVSRLREDLDKLRAHSDAQDERIEWQSQRIAEQQATIDSYEDRLDEWGHGIKILTTQLVTAGMEPEWSP